MLEQHRHRRHNKTPGRLCRRRGEGRRPLQTAATTKPQGKTVVQENTDKEKPETKPLQTEEEIVIKKYIKRSVYNKLNSACGNNLQTLIDILKAINEINRNLDVNYQGKVKIIKDKQLIFSKTVKTETGCSLVQSCDTDLSNDRKRLVWTMGDGPEGPVIVGLGFYKEHMGTQSKRGPYRIKVDEASRRQSFSKDFLQEECYDVQQLLIDLQRQLEEKINRNKITSYTTNDDR